MTEHTKNLKLDQLHETLIEILDYVSMICVENELTYFLVYGTALGAYRHKGFIPWDDDVDIAMPREDYERLLEILQTNKNSKYEIQNERNEDKYFLSFAKVRKNGTVFIESIAEDIYKNNGVYIDIFPLDYVGNKDSIAFKMKKKLINYIKHILKFNSCKQLFKSKESKIEYVCDLILSSPARFLTNKQMLKILNTLMIGNVSKEKAKYLAQYDESTDAAVMPYDVYFPPQKIKFGNKFYYAPNNLDAYLKNQYGETYMQIPGPEDRHTHQPIKLEL